MAFFLRYLSVILLTYNVIILICSFFLYKHYTVFKDEKGKKYFLVLTFIGLHSLYLLFEYFILKNNLRIYTIPFGLLYGPVIYNAIVDTNHLDMSKLKKYIGFLPFFLYLL